MEETGAKSGTVWVFHGEGSRYTSAVFSTETAARSWIHQHRLSGMLTAYPLDIGVYDWALKEGVFKPSSPEEASPKFIQRFTHASMEHYHFEGDEEPNLIKPPIQKGKGK